MFGVFCADPLLSPDNHPKVVLTPEGKTMIERDRRLREKNYGGVISKYREALLYCYTDCGYIKKRIALTQLDREWYRGSQLWHQKDWSGAIPAYKKALRYCRSDMDCDYLRYNINIAQRKRASDMRKTEQ